MLAELRLLEITRAWLVAALGGMFMGVVWRLTGHSFGTHITGLAVLLGGTVAYPSAVMVAVPGTPVVWRVLPPALFAGLFWFVA
ncbi:hypothetical protein [Nonomuraea sp. NPDC003804]|uniref:hypothetical protein n=1 Tax=Nonomuraea sp. NPDC003804 TaxID=3154547 RepID=UPI0033BD8661